MLYIMRHGKTDWNVLHKIQGRTDIPLNAEGRAMAEAAQKEYQNVHFDICYCSPLARAKETAKIVLLGREIPIVYDARLMEMSFGSCEGAQYPISDSPVSLLFQKPEQYTAVDGGESLDELFARTGSFLEEIITPALEKNKDILIVGHGAMNCSIVCQIKGLPVSRFWDSNIENCKLIQLM